jgi:hypothetical protein
MTSGVRSLLAWQTYADFLGFVRLCNDHVRGVRVDDAIPVSPVGPLPIETFVCSTWASGRLRIVSTLYYASLNIGPLQYPAAFPYWRAPSVLFHPALLTTLTAGPSCPNHDSDAQAVEKVVAMLDDFHGWVSEIPPLQQPMRFGNKAFRTWHTRLVERAPGYMRGFLPQVRQPVDDGGQTRLEEAWSACADRG